MKRPPEKIRYSNFQPFCSYLGLMPQRLFIITESKHCLIPYKRCKVCSLMYNLSVSSFHGTFEASKIKRKRHNCYRWTTTGLHAWTSGPCNHGTMHSITSCQYCTKFSICYLNANTSTPVFTSYPIIMHKQLRVSSENVVMQTQRKIHFQLRL